MAPGEREVSEQSDLVADRIEFIELLRDDTLETRDIVDRLDHSRSTVTRALRALRQADLIKKSQAGYTATVAGAMAADQYRRHEAAMAAIVTAKDVLDPIPPSATPPVEFLIDADTTPAEADVPVRALETITDELRGADTVQLYLPTLINTHLLRVWHRSVVADRLESDAMFDPDLLTVLKGQYPQLLSEMAATESFAAFVTGELPYGLLLATHDGTPSASLVVYEDETAIRGVITNDTDAAVEWARTKLARLEAAGTEVTGELEALSAAVTDGLADTASAPLTPADDAGTSADASGHGLPLQLATEGFVRLSEAYFDARTAAPPAVSWRTGFTLTEVAADHAVARLDEEGRNLPDRIRTALHAGDDHVVLGPPGSGKSTICMQVACGWYDRGHGPVLYRERGAGDGFASTALLEAYLRQTDGHTLVVVEDAVREQASAVFEVMHALDDVEGVTFLLDARDQEWQESDSGVIDARREAYRHTAIDRIEVPAFDERDCHRFVDHFSSLVDTEFDLSGAELYSLVGEGADTRASDGIAPGEALVAQHYLSRQHDPLATHTNQAPTALDEAVRQTYHAVADAETVVALDLAVLINALNAAGIPVAPEYLYALADADDAGDFATALAMVEGQLIFDPTQRSGAGSPTTYRTRHETWSVRFLEQFLALEPTEAARQRFGHCLTRVLSLADATDRRRRIERRLDGRTPHLHRIDADPTAWADELVERLFDVGRSASDLAPLFGETGESAITLPEACSTWTRTLQAYWRGQANRLHGDLDRAEREFRTLQKRAEHVAGADEGAPTPLATGRGTSRRSTPDQELADPDASGVYLRAVSRLNLGAVARERGDLDAAADQFDRSLTLFREVGDRHGEATAIKSLGNVSYKTGKLETARDQYERGLELFRELGDKRGEAATLHNLGILDFERDESAAAAESLRESLDVYRELGDTAERATVRRNLGRIARERGDLDAATEQFERSLHLCREVGDRYGEAAIFRNLGEIAQQRDELASAAERLERSLSHFREMGARQEVAHTLEYRGAVARARGETDRASRYLEEALEICREIGDQDGEAAVLLERGILAQEQGDPSTAEARFGEAADIFIEMGSRKAQRALERVIDVCRDQDRVDEAQDWCRKAIDYAERMSRPELREQFEHRLSNLGPDTEQDGSTH